MTELQHTVESELKYRTTGMTLPSCDPANIIGDVVDEIEGTGIDVFYYRPETRNKEFLRYRHNEDGQELTRKIKLNGSNVNRIEETIKLSDDETQANINLFLQAGGYVKGNQLTKKYLVWFGSYGILSYYKVYLGGNFQGAFVEVEAYSEDNEFERARCLRRMKENLSKYVKLTDKHLEPKSMFELYGA